MAKDKDKGLTYRKVPWKRGTFAVGYTGLESREVIAGITEAEADDLLKRLHKAGWPIAQSRQRAVKK